MKYSIEEITNLNKEIQVVNNQLIQAQSKLELKRQQQQQILAKYNINSKEELEAYKLKLQVELDTKVEEATEYMLKVKEHIAKINSLIGSL